MGDVDRLRGAAAQLKNTGKTIFAVALGGRILKENIKQIVSSPYATHMFDLKTKDNFRETVERLVNAICTDDIFGLNILEI